MKILMFIFYLLFILIGCKTPNSAFPIESQWFKTIEKTFRKELDEVQLYPYHTKVEVSGNENRFVIKDENKIIIYLLPFEKISLDEKLLTEEYFQTVRHLYKTRQDFIREYYTVFKTCLVLSNLVIYGSKSARKEVSTIDIFLFSIAFLKKHHELGVNTNRLREVYSNIIEYWKTSSKKPSLAYLYDEKEILDALVSFKIADRKSFDEIKNELSSTNFSK